MTGTTTIAVKKASNAPAIMTTVKPISASLRNTSAVPEGFRNSSNSISVPNISRPNIAPAVVHAAITPAQIVRELAWALRDFARAFGGLWEETEVGAYGFRLGDQSGIVSLCNGLATILLIAE